MEEEVKLTEEQQGDVHILRIEGRLDAVSSPEAEKKVMEIIGDEKRKIAMDFSLIL